VSTGANVPKSCSSESKVIDGWAYEITGNSRIIVIRQMIVFMEIVYNIFQNNAMGSKRLQVPGKLF
jgi:hypothetical protein